MNMILADRYELIKKIGSGGMGDVYQAHDKKLDRIVAIKVLKSEYNNDDNFIRKFRRESLAAASISHPNIVSIYDVGTEEMEDSKMYYIVMEYIDGHTLKELIEEEGFLPQNQALNYLIQIAEALKVAHSKNIVHRDIKSQNIMITKDNRVKVTDFGIARMAGNSTVTVTNAVMGSVHYFSPEQARGQKVDARSDIYSMGIVLYEMLTGDVPFDSENPITVALMHVQNPIPVPSSINPKVSPNVDQIFLNMTMKKPQDRYDNVSQIIEDVKSVLLNRSALDDIAGDTTSTVILPPNRERRAEEEERLQDTIPPRIERKKPEQKSQRKRKKGGSGTMLGALAAIIFVLALLILFPLLRNRSNEDGELLTMPNFVGESIEYAQDFADDNGLILEITDREISDEVPENTVLRQSIPENTKVREGDSFSVVISRLRDTVSVPSLENMTIEEAQNQLGKLNLTLQVSQTEFSSSVPNDRIISQDPKGGTQMEKGGTVAVVVSKGTENTLSTVPNLRGVTVDRAQTLLNQQGLSLGNVERRSDNNVAEGEIIWQQYESGNQIKKGSNVDVIVSSGPPQQKNNTETNTTPDTSNQEKNLNLSLTVSGSDIHSIEVIKIPQSGNRSTVYTGNHEGGKAISIPVTGVKGDQFEIYVDGKREKVETVK